VRYRNGNAARRNELGKRAAVPRPNVTLFENDDEDMSRRHYREEGCKIEYII